MSLKTVTFSVPLGEVTVALQEDGSVAIDSPAGPEVMEVWTLPEAFADELVWYGVDRETALALYRDFDAHRPHPE